MISLLCFIEACGGRPDALGPLPPIASAWSLLDRAYRADPDATEDVLAHPQVGVWLAYTLRRLETGGDSPPSSAPLWVDVGYLHAVGVAAGARAGLSFELAVPLRAGFAVLPTLGVAAFADGPQLATAHADAGHLRLVAGDLVVHARSGAAGWREPATVEAESDGIRLVVELVDHDAYRELQVARDPQPLSEQQIAAWREHVTRAWALLVREHRGRAESMAVGLRTLAPSRRRKLFRPMSASGAEAFGGISLSEPDDAVQMAVTLVHEVQHHRLGALQHLLTLVEDVPERRFYAPWRDDPRPLNGLLQGAYAFAGITDFWCVRRRHARGADLAIAELEQALWWRQTLLALDILAGSERLTGHGSKFVAILRQEVERSGADGFPDPARRSAARLAVDHRALWRAANVRVGSGTARALADAWRRGTDAGEPLPPRLRDAHVVGNEPRFEGLDTRAVLTRLRLLRPALFDEFRAAAHRIGEHVTGALPADVALAAGETDRARAGYLEILTADPGSGRAWVGLGLTCDPGSPERRALLGRPELVLAVAGTIGAAPADALGLATWIGQRIVEREPADDPAGWRIAPPAG
ncbi:HEXXH motif domain-containing protein [Dactylosporangium sp. CA-092794]|uniref:HEXXH motif domain-containing protein n=1 Tax=Dactylosporangium sp. CA-092794 TaxID=3239929 RepID=UPI003D8B3B08